MKCKYGSKYVRTAIIIVSCFSFFNIINTSYATEAGQKEGKVIQLYSSTKFFPEKIGSNYCDDTKRKERKVLRGEMLGYGHHKDIYFFQEMKKGKKNEKKSSQADRQWVLGITRGERYDGDTASGLRSMIRGKEYGIPMIDFKDKLYCAPCDEEFAIYLGKPLYCTAIMTEYKPREDYIEIHIDGGHDWLTIISKLKEASARRLVEDLSLILKIYKKEKFALMDFQGFINRHTGAFVVFDPLNILIPSADPKLDDDDEFYDPNPTTLFPDPIHRANYSQNVNLLQSIIEEIKKAIDWHSKNTPDFKKPKAKQLKSRL